MTNEEPTSVTVSISVDEWRDIVQWMYVSLVATEHSQYGHFLLECDGTRRTWVTSDGAQTTVIYGEGPPPRGLADPNEHFAVLVNSRFFRRRSPQDATLTITNDGEHRTQTFTADGVRATLPEHPDDFGDWRAVLASATGAPVDVDTDHLRDACQAAFVVPWGVDIGDNPVFTWISIADGQLILESPWIDYPSTVVEVPLRGRAADTVPALVNIARLIDLLAAIDMPTTTLRLPSEPMAPIGVRAARYDAVLMPVDRWGAEREHLEKLLCDFLGVESVAPDDDGDYAVTSPEGHTMWVRLYTGYQPISIQVFSVLATNVEPTLGLLDELNAINATIAHVKVILTDGAVIAEADLVAETLDAAELVNALRVVRRTAEKYNEVLSAFYGAPGEVPPHDALEGTA